jgi:arsenate reductase
VINYKETPFSKDELKNLIALLGIKPIDLVRKNETIWKEKFKDRKLTNTQVISALLKHPNLIQRPIVVHGDKAIIARPLELIDSIL